MHAFKPNRAQRAIHLPAQPITPDDTNSKIVLHEYVSWKLLGGSNVWSYSHFLVMALLRPETHSVHAAFK